MLETHARSRRRGYARVSTYGQTLDAQLELVNLQLELVNLLNDTAH
jgi:hypothetical protein